MNRKSAFSAVVAAALACTSPWVLAQATPGTTSPATTPVPGGYGPGMMAGPGWGSGPFGPGMMEGRRPYGGGYGPGMMGGRGPGAYGGGMGPMMGAMGFMGRGGMGPYYALNLNEQQRTSIAKIQDEMRQKHWGLMGQLFDEQARMNDLFAAETRDPKAIGAQSMKVAELRRQLLEAAVEAQNRMEAVLSKEQREQMRSFHRGWMMDDD